MEIGLSSVKLGNLGIGAADVVRVARSGALVALNPAAVEAVAASAAFVEAMAAGEHAVYGVSTGFGWM
jgi:histidine ammonia-lyase